MSPDPFDEIDSCAPERAFPASRPNCTTKARRSQRCGRGSVALTRARGESRRRRSFSLAAIASVVRIDRDGAHRPNHASASALLRRHYRCRNSSDIVNGASVDDIGTGDDPVTTPGVVPKPSTPGLTAPGTVGGRRKRAGDDAGVRTAVTAAVTPAGLRRRGGSQDPGRDVPTTTTVPAVMTRSSCTNRRAAASRSAFLARSTAC